MRKIETSKEIQELTKNLKAQGKTIAFVPTMGFLHDGHLSLIDKARQMADVVVVSIFVNEKQFNNTEDFANYPIDIDSDLKKLENRSVDIVFIPSNEEVYPAGKGDPEIYLESATDNVLCGKSRPGHFEGVCKVLRRLFDVVNPDYAIFGLKDFQQYLIVKKMVNYFKLPIEVIGADIVRCESGLAMSSRNHNLSLENKDNAALIYEIMKNTKNEVKKTGNINSILQNSIRDIEKNSGFRVDYFEIRKESDLSIVTNHDNVQASRLFASVNVGEVRLIDNLSI